MSSAYVVASGAATGDHHCRRHTSSLTTLSLFSCSLYRSSPVVYVVFSTLVVGSKTLTLPSIFSNPSTTPMKMARGGVVKYTPDQIRKMKDSIRFQKTSEPVELIKLVVLISATLPNEILEMTSKFMTDPVRILVKCDELTLEGIKQFLVAVEREEWKFDTFCDLYDTLTITQAVIFCNTKRKCFSFISGVSGTSLLHAVSLMAYNVFYTSIPVLVSLVDKDLSEGTVMQHPQILYYCQAGRLLNPPTFAGWFGRSQFHIFPE
ncbi:hypothetical protein ACSBR2_002899 [Camellia fascicularis]